MNPGPLPAVAAAWVETATGARVVEAARMAGATTVEVHRVVVEDERGRRALAIRRYAVPGYLAEWPGRPAHEAAVLGLLDPTPVPAPHVVAVDADGSGCGVPAVLMTAVGGAVDREQAATGPGCAALAEVLAALHRVDPVAVGRTYRPYHRGHAVVVPPWSTVPGAWEEAAAVAPPEGAAVLIHRDFHPGNVLWAGGSLSGVVDWGETCRGPAGVDVAHCRVNLALFLGPDAADRFTAAYEARTGTSHERRWDLVAAVDLLPHDAGEQAVAGWPGGAFSRDRRRRIDAFLVAALLEG
jgi:aminoglycoside phosphotransferase (APT) family kinase protein